VFRIAALGGSVVISSADTDVALMFPCPSGGNGSFNIPIVNTHTFDRNLNKEEQSLRWKVLYSKCPLVVCHDVHLHFRDTNVLHMNAM